MPALGASMESGTLVRWLKAPGDAVHKGDIIAVVDTEKGAIEIEVFEDGVLDRIVVEPGAEVPVGAVLAVIRGAGDTAAAPLPAAPPVAPPLPAAPPAVAPPPVAPPQVAPPRASPAARQRAKELGIDLAMVHGTGPGGVIERADVERAQAPVAAAVEPPDAALRMRQAIAVAMARSKREIPHFYLSASVDVQRALAWLAATNATTSVEARLLPAVLLIKAVALAARDVSEVNGYWIDGAFQPGPGVHPGVAIALRGGGLIAPALHAADRTDLATLMTHFRDLVTRARSGGLRSSELTDATITITNLGEQGVEGGYGIIYPPQVALVSFGRVIDRPVAVDGQVTVHPVIQATLSADHRAIDGHRAGRFLAAVDRYLQEPERL